MKVQILLIFVQLAIINANTKCGGCINQKCFIKNTILNNHDATGQILSIDKLLNILYIRVKDGKDRDFTGSIDLNNTDYTITDLTPNNLMSSGRAVDEKTHNAYISKSSGIFIYNPLTNITENVPLIDEVIKDAQFIHDTLYYTTIETKYVAPRDKKTLYTFKDGVKDSIGPLNGLDIDEFIVDKNGDIYFVTRMGFTIRRLKKNARSYREFSKHLASFALNREGDLHILTTHRKLFKLNYETDTLDQIGSIREGIPDRFVIDIDGNIIYKDMHVDKLYYLKSTDENC